MASSSRILECTCDLYLVGDPCPLHGNAARAQRLAVILESRLLDSIPEHTLCICAHPKAIHTSGPYAATMKPNMWTCSAAPPQDKGGPERRSSGACEGEEVFLPYIVDPQGNTVAEVVLPRLKTAYAALPAKTGNAS